MNKKIKKGILTLHIIVVAILISILIAVVISYTTEIKNLFKSASQTQFDEVCCCRDGKCAMLLKHACDEGAKFGYKIDDVKKCDEVAS